jgi:hypothetical protein
MERGIFGGLGVVVALFGALFFVFFVGELSTGGDGKTQPGVYAGLVVFFGGVMASGAYLAWRMLFSRRTASGAARPGAGSTGGAARRRASQQATTPDDAPPATPAERERRVLRLAEAEHGRVTIPEVASRCTMTIEESKRELDRLVLSQVAEIQVTASGVLVYVFPGFLSDEDKARASDF